MNFGKLKLLDCFIYQGQSYIKTDEKIGFDVNKSLKFFHPNDVVELVIKKVTISRRSIMFENMPTYFDDLDIGQCFHNNGNRCCKIAPTMCLVEDNQGGYVTRYFDRSETDFHVSPLPDHAVTPSGIKKVKTSD